MPAPSKTLLSLEGIRALYEYSLGWVLNVPLQYISPAGDQHPVMIIPGLGTADGSTHYIRNFLNKIGYNAYPWGLGRNLGPRNGIDPLLSQICERVEEISDLNGGKEVSIIGWSLGGIYGREVAKVIPGKTRQVITLGTPFKGSSDSTNASALYQLLSNDRSHKDPNMISRIAAPPPVPFTSIYSKSDGVVHWESSIETPGNYIENIEVPGASHLGLGHNPITMYIIANRLTQTKDSWLPYKS